MNPEPTSKDESKNTGKLSDIKIVEKDWLEEGQFALVTPPNTENTSPSETPSTSPNQENTDELDRQIEEAIKDGLSNHTGEWFNGFIAPGLSLDEQQSRDLLFYLTKANRLKENLAKLINQKCLEARIDEVNLHRLDRDSNREYHTRMYLENRQRTLQSQQKGQL
jgi:hypothetical protein